MVSLHAFSYYLACTEMSIDVSVILPVHNAEQWLDECLQSIYNQDYSGAFEVSIFNDHSTDSSSFLIEEWSKRYEKKGITVVVSGSTTRGPHGVGFARNCAIRQSSGKFLCFLDADDVMSNERIGKQHAAALQHRDALIGSQFTRIPHDSTERFTKWANSLSREQLLTQIYTSHGPTVIMPTWFCSREVFDRVGKFDETGKGTPEDLIFFYEHMKCGGDVVRVDLPLLMYRYHPHCETFSVHEDTIWDLRIQRLQDSVLTRWTSFTIWSAGKQGRHFYRSLHSENQEKVTAFCDVDVKKITKGCYTYEDSKQRPKPKVPIVHFSKAKPPLIICVKQDLTSGSFEQNLASLGLTEGTDYFHFG